MPPEQDPNCLQYQQQKKSFADFFQKKKKKIKKFCQEHYQSAQFLDPDQSLGPNCWQRLKVIC